MPAGKVTSSFFAPPRRWYVRRNRSRSASTSWGGRSMPRRVLSTASRSYAGSHASSASTNTWASCPSRATPRGVSRALDIVAQASTRPEPFGRTIVEAMACGRPVLVARGGGAVELFDDGVEAQGFEPGDVLDLASELAKLVGSSTRRAALADRARARVTRQFGRPSLRAALYSNWEPLEHQPVERRRSAASRSR